MKNLVFAYYGDDFTGSTDALEFLCCAGIKTMLFIEPPTIDELLSYPDLHAFGVAGKTRSLSSGKMEETLLPAFETIKATGVKQVHYKVCSTFDSSPNIGSIGKAIDVGMKVFDNDITPVIGGTPALGRYCVFGNLFAKMGIGSNGKIYRLDKHPSMSRHPVTPMNESDLRIHLSNQTNKRIGLIDVMQLNNPVNEWEASEYETILLIDTLHVEQLQKIGEYLISLQANNETVFSVGGSSIEMALGKYWNDKQIAKPVDDWENIEPHEYLLVISGSCSPVTQNQIKYAAKHGFVELIIASARVCEEGLSETTLMAAADLLQRYKKLIVHTGNKLPNNLSSEKIGTALGQIAKYLVEENMVNRVIVAGGDTSSYAARAMEIDAVEMIAPVVVGAPLCKAYSNNESINGLEVNFKGGQVGSENYFTLF
jgi:uncharacterized protein YgbK (DUF1537 family)